MGKPNTTSYVQQFAKAYGLGHALHDESGSSWLEVSEPVTLANFVAFCKGRRVYLRGQNSYHCDLLPSLFRETVAHVEWTARWNAYKSFLQKLPKQVRGTRFGRRNFGAVLQHYGFRTPWLDVVDDMHAAVWFALNRRSALSGALQYRRTEADFGWIVVVAAPRPVCVQDLRTEHSSRNTRCHVQQGFSIAMQRDDEAEPRQEQDFARYVLGTVRIPNCQSWHLRGFRASQAYLFPSRTIDDTYDQLLSPRVAECADEAERDHHLAPETLGRVDMYTEESSEQVI